MECENRHEQPRIALAVVRIVANSLTGPFRAAKLNRVMNYPILFEKMDAEDFPGYYYAHLPTLGLTTHGMGVEDARAAALDLARLWIGEKRANGETFIS